MVKAAALIQKHKNCKNHASKQVVVANPVVFPLLLCACVQNGMFEMEIMSMSLGNSNGMAAGSVGKKKGIVGTISINGQNITQGRWMTRVGLVGESDVSSIPFSKIDNTTRSGVWLQTSFALGQELNTTQQILLDLTGLDIGIAYVNNMPVAR